MTTRARAFLLILSVSVTIWSSLVYGVSSLGSQPAVDGEITASIK